MGAAGHALTQAPDISSIREDDVSTSTRLTPSISETTSKSPRGTLYRGREGMWSWVLHRITGVAIFFFLLVHVLDTALIRVSPEAYDAVIGTYKNPIMAFGEVVLVAGIVFHAMNGLRIILVDFWAKGAQYQRQMFWIVIGVWAVVMAGFIPRHLGLAFAGFGGDH
ncbi:succinate dehydrogenase, cytochrome b556 subunit [Microbacterium esteraromaticum]|uniref:Succinate dehydrogenase, cytochrome b556 subunit n=1 Tax=Microbacterium esteraromaticum TaxID=57043 RepID=A0A939ISK0_9MICO|nr:succinate dehydrogenase, cytochrome b556 subunit [Microbacterium esteraromaticum]MBN8206945.1 succinate dehydrogenase, cytochrome b556 subunit [Microbacterium esteraromaticum]MBN8417100.1 succinate dehydrogenase, cytochrome b556 subunit [Microbacterium esteraromaticum]MBN8425729.1 succinate dehydrogenase, cytochrome b556 subunit [Microbacterium esteraromaticum]